MRVGLYCGAFDPIGNHHIECAIQLLNYVDRVLIIPDYVSLSGKKIININHRIEMCQLALADALINIKHVNRILVSKFQVENQCTTTQELLQLIKQEFKDNDYYVAIGVDNAMLINT